MKTLIRISVVFFGCMVSVLGNATSSGFLDAEIEPVPGRIEAVEVPYLVDSMPYTPGGITFSYPASFFTGAPCVFVQAEVPTAIGNTAFIATVSDNSLTGVTVYIYLESIISGNPSVLTDSGSMAYPVAMVEASLLDNVTVHLLAIEG